MRPTCLLFLTLPSLLLFSCTQKNGQGQGTPMATPAAAKVSAADLAKHSKATFAAGCFWCEEAVFESIRGVAEVISGYAGGEEKNPTYEQVSAGRTGHAEAVEVYYDPAVISYETLLRVYFASLDPTQVNGQGPDHGAQYRSVIFYRNLEEKAAAEKYIADLTASGKYNRPIVVQVVPFTEFWTAEDYHQDYVPRNPQNPYVQHESIPRLRRTQEQVKDLVK
jgi:peptide-methionine (S)-S-oxide reductase